MRRAPKLISSCVGAVAVVLTASACGTEKINVPLSAGGGTLHAGAVLFSQRCAGCHTLSYAATHGSAYNVRTAQYNNGPNFDIRCERPVARVLYAIENGGFSGAIMPQNIVVGQDARDVAQFVATYSGRKAPRVPGVTPCQQVPLGSIEQALASSGSAATSGAATLLSTASGTKKVKTNSTGPASSRSGTTNPGGGGSGGGGGTGTGAANGSS
jgi:mono/diheme cytochrome c family protein